MTAWVHFMNQLMEGGTDRRAIESRMNLLLSREPALDTEESRQLLDRLRATLVPSRAIAGTPEALIDALVDMRAGEDGAWRRLVELGFDAVPALLNHLNDERLTRTYNPGFNNFPPHPTYVGKVVSDLVKELAGNELEWDYQDHEWGRRLVKSEAQNWLARARKVGEEEYLVRNVLPDRPVAPRTDVQLNEQMLMVLAKKYPSRLPELYRRLLRERPDAASDSLAKTIAAGPLTKAQKTGLFHLAAETPDLKQRATALRQLRDLDHEQFVIDLVKGLDDIKQSPVKVKSGCPEWAFAGLVDSTSDARAWQALRGAAERVDARARIEMLDGVGTKGRKSSAPQQKNRLEFLAIFLDDATVRTLSKYDKSRRDDFINDHFVAESKFLRLEVRDFAALRLAKLLEIDDSPNKGWTAKDWAGFRARVRERLSREKIDPDSLPHK